MPRFPLRRWRWIITLPFGLALVAFAVVNRQAVTVDLWPLPWSATLPLFVPLLGFGFLGALAGAATLAVGRAHWRRRARLAQAQVEALTRELARQKAPTAQR